MARKLVTELSSFVLLIRDTPCRHSSEPWRRYSMPVYVKMMHNVTASWGNNSACVVDQAKRWAFQGDGLTSDGGTDLIKFVINATDCASSSDAPLTAADSNGVAMYLETDSTSTFILESEAAGQLVNLCYKFGNEEFMWYDIQAFAHKVQSVDSRVGGKDIAVVDAEEVLVVNAYGSSTEDYMRWIVSNETSDIACNDTVVVRDSPNEGANEMTEMSIYHKGGYFLANFTFSESSAGFSPILCYKFAGTASFRTCSPLEMSYSGLLSICCHFTPPGAAELESGISPTLAFKPQRYESISFMKLFPL